MTIWKFFCRRGDDLFLCITLIAVALQADPQIPANMMHWVVDLGVIAGIVHKVFFPTPPVIPASKE